MAVGSRHIRHDFNTWVDWDQKSVRTACGATTKRHLAGIPGITPQPRTVDTGQKKIWGWCGRCVNSAWSSIDNNANDEMLDQRVGSLYTDAREQIAEQYRWQHAKMLETREARRRQAGTSNTL